MGNVRVKLTSESVASHLGMKVLTSLATAYSHHGMRANQLPIPPQWGRAGVFNIMERDNTL
eukprot:849816-Heterocapsa_arctica.AAC.1